MSFPYSLTSAEFFPNLPDSDIIQRTRAFEYQQFSTCKSRQEYLQRISDGISNVQQVAQRQAPLNRSSNSNQNCQQQPQPQHYQYQHHHQNHGQQQIAHTMTATQLRYLPGGSAQPTDAFPQAHNHPSNPSMMDHFPPSQFNRQVATQDQFVISGHAQRCPQHSLHPAVFQPPQVCCEQPSHMTHVPSTYFQPSPPPVGITPNHSSTCMPSPRANFSADVSLSNVEASNFSNMELNGVNTSTGSLAKVSQESYSIADTTLENISVPGVTANKFSAHDSQFDEIVPSLSEEQKSAKEKRQALCKARAVVRKNRLKRIRQGNEQVQPATNEVTGLCDSQKRPRLEIQGLESMNFVHLFPIEGSTGQSMNREEVNLVSKRIRNIQKQYSKTIQVLGPIVENFQEMQSQQGREKFAKKLRWVAKMLSVQSTEDIPKWLNLEVLDRAERFVVELIRSYVPRLKKIIRDSTATPERKVELTRRIEDCVLPAYEFARKNPHSLGPYSLQYAHINILFQPTRTKSCEVPSTTPPLFSVGSQNQLELYRQGHVHSTTYVPKSHSSQEIYADPGNNDSNVSTTDVLRGQGTSASQSEMQSGKFLPKQ